MADPVQGILLIQTTGSETRITLNPDTADITAGGNGGAGDLILRYASGTEAVRLGRVQELAADLTSPTPVVIADYIGLRVKDSSGRNLVQLGRRAAGGSVVNPPDEIHFILGTTGSSGTIGLKDKNDKTRVILGEDQNQDGRFAIFDANGRRLLEFDPQYAALIVGAQGNEGDLILRNNDGDQTVKLDGGSRSLRLGTSAQPRIRLEKGNAWLGGNGDDGDLLLFRSSGNNTSVGQSTFHASGGDARLDMGGNGANAFLGMRAADGSNRVRLDAGGGNLWLGGNGADGDLVIFSASGDNQTTSNASIHLNGDAGDIVLRNADCAEEFDLADEGSAPPRGTVMVLDDRGQLRPSDIPYDRRVAGIVSGAGEYRPAIVLDRQVSGTGRVPIALVGKVFCQADATGGAIGVGDLLTTSATRGHAMKAGDPARAFGCVLGKALGRLAHGTGLIPVLVALQ